MDVQKIYSSRFNPDLQFRDKMWEILCKDFFQQYITKDNKILEIGAGYCEFINHIQGGYKIAMDINPDTKKFADSDVHVVLSDSTNMSSIADSSVDIVFASNFFEHLDRKEIVLTFREVYRVLSPGGKFLVLQPNIRFCAKDYWMFFDHVTPIDDRAFVEGLTTIGFTTLNVIERFLPYTTKSSFPKSPFLIKLYLRLGIIWRLFGQQSFILSCKPL